LQFAKPFAYIALIFHEKSWWLVFNRSARYLHKEFIQVESRLATGRDTVKANNNNVYENINQTKTVYSS